MSALRDTLRGVVGVGGRCVVTSAVPQGASAGIAALAQGGNAFDAALAACFVETVALPMKCGLAGDLVALFRQGGQPWRALVSIGAGGAAIARGAKLERLGPLSVGVPGAPHGYAQLHAMARLPLSTLIGPGLRAARHGVAWTEAGLSYLRAAEGLLRTWSPDCEYLRHLQARPGDALHLPGLGDWLEAFARRGAALFEGVGGEPLWSRVQALGGWLSEADLRQRPARLAEPALLELPGGDRLWATPGPTQGPLLLDVVRQACANGLIAARAGSLDTNSFDGSELARLVAGARSRGTARPQDTGTSVVSAADDAGNAVIVVHSNSFPRFGSGVVLESGLVLNNRPGRGFDLDAPQGSPSAPAAGAVPPTTLHAWLLQREGATVLGATPGGINQLSWNAQSLTELLAGAEPVDVVLNPRWAMENSGAYRCEEGVTLNALNADVDVGPALSQRSVQQMLRWTADGRLSACADPRTGASAAALY